LKREVSVRRYRVTASWSGSLSLFVLLTCPDPLPAQAQTGEDLPPGSWVRVTTTAPARRFAGSLVRITRDSLLLSKTSRDTVALPRASVTRLERSAGRRPNYTKGALIGGGAGFALGLGIGAVGNGLAEGGCETASGCGNLGQSLAVGGAVGAGLGAGVGVLLALAFKGEGWQPVAGVGPRPKTTVGLQLRF
jgi:hypothetical protein